MESYDFRARPGQELDTHLDGVAETAVRLVDDNATTPMGTPLEDIVHTIASLHDIGKYTTYFQNYLDEGDRRQPRLIERHADVGAYLSYLALRSIGHPREEWATGFHAVMRHHGGIPNVDTYQQNLSTRTKLFEALSEKLHDIDDHATPAVDERLQTATNGELQWADVPLDDPRAYCKPIFNFREFDGFYPLLLRIWSTLTCADKLDAASVSIGESTRRPDPDAIGFDNTASGVTSELNDRRTEARRDAVRNLTDHSDAGLYTLTLPTGFGKTFAGLEAALSKASNTGGRVIYALPYTTVIDQVDEQIRDQLGVRPTSERYTIHHHLADTRTELDADDDRPSSRAETLYGETWQAGLVLTTFVQLFESLAGPGNVQSMKLPALENSVVIVDEPQALPRRWWHLVSRLAAMLVDRYDATIVFMTATQPRFVDEYNSDLDATELIENTDEYFSFLETHERVRFEIDDSLAAYLADSSSSATLPIEAAARRLVPSEDDDRRTRLAVNNTVRCAAAVSESVERVAAARGHDVVSLNAAVPSFVAERGADILNAVRDDDPSPSLTDLAIDLLDDIAVDRSEQGLLVGVLTAALRPIERALLIEVVRTLLDADTDDRVGDWPLVVSATQLVEAGVDVSFDRVYRDFAPMPSLVQAAGRCNRSFEQDIGTVTLWRLAAADDRRPPSEQTYQRQRSRLEATRTTLRTATTDEQRVIREARMVSPLIDTYYEHLHSGDHTTSDADDLVRSFDRAEGDDLRSASIIEDDAAEFLVITNDADCHRLDAYLADKDGETASGGRDAFGELTYLLASARFENPNALDDTPEVLADIGHAETALEELRVVDARNSSRYSVRHGLGLYSRDEVTRE